VTAADNLPNDTTSTSLLSRIRSNDRQRNSIQNARATRIATMKRLSHSHGTRQTSCSIWSHRTLGLERLEPRLSPALLAPGADAEAFARYYAATDGPNQISDPADHGERARAVFH
jgi:hypothetical protein